MTKTTTSRILTALGVSLCIGAVPLAGPAVAHAANGQGTIRTYAGGGVGDHGAATSATIYPDQVAVDAFGALYVTDQQLARVRVIRDGVVTTLAGTGDPGYSGDGGSATAAQIGADVRGITVDHAGNVYIGDTDNGCVRRIDTHGIITTVASMLRSPEGVAVDSGGNLFVAETGLNRIVELAGGSGSPATVAGTGEPGYTGDGVPATAAGLSAPQGVAVDPVGNLYIADTGNNRVREVDAASKTISTVVPAPNGAVSQYTLADTSAVNAPQAVTTDAHGVVYVADTGNHRVLSIGGGAVSARVQLSVPVTGVAVAPANRPYAVYAALSTGVFRTGAAADSGQVVAGALARTPPGADGIAATDADMAPRAVAVDPAGNLVIADVARIRRVTPSGRIDTLAGSGTNPWWLATPGYRGQIVTGERNRTDPGGLPARIVNLDPISVAVSRDGTVYFGDGFTHRVLRIDRDGVLRDVAGAGNGTGIPSSGSPAIDQGGPALEAGLDYPWALTFGPTGDLYIADTGQDMNQYPADQEGVVDRVDGRGVITTIAGAGNATAVAGGAPCPEAIVNSNVTPDPPIDNVPATQSCLNNPSGLAFDHAGNLYIAEWGANRVRRVDTGGTITTVAGNNLPDFDGNEGADKIGEYGLSIGDGQPATAASLNEPRGLAVDGAGDLFIADTGNQVVREVDTSGTISSVVGNATTAFQNRTTAAPTTVADGTAAYDPLVAPVASLLPPAGTVPRGDGGSATAAALRRPAGVALSSAGDLFIADPADYRVREVGGLGATGGHAARSGARAPARARPNHAF